ncbi:hypothetical protein D3C85_1732110 [compost metagenome]
MARDEDDRQLAVEPALERDAVHARHLEIQHHAGRARVRRAGVEEGPGIAKAHRLVAVRLDQPHQRAHDARVIVDDIHRGNVFAHGATL